MSKRDVSIVIFHDNLGNIIFQERKEHSRVGEKYGFFGGGLEDNETKEEAIKRELKEELGFVPESLNYWTDYSFIVGEENNYKGWQINLYVFLSPITKDLDTAVVNEGGIIKMNIKEAVKNNLFSHYDLDLLSRLMIKLDIK